MVTAVRSLGLQGISGYEVTVECFLSGGLPAFDIVGLGDTAVKESRERVRAAVKNCGVKFPVSRITVNLAPAGRKKEGTLYDLPILLGILASAEEIKPPAKDAAFVGELSLTGTLRAVNGVLPMAMAAVRAGIRTLYVPAANAAEATLADGVTVYGVPDVVSLVQHLKGEKKLSPQPKWQAEQTSETGPDFSDVMGQENVKRALEIAAAGGHNLLLIGSPGAGKSMLARRLPSILPDMTRAESLQTTEIYSVAGLTEPSHPLVTHRPFRSPHHTASPVSLSGGGTALGDLALPAAHLEKEERGRAQGQQQEHGGAVQARHGGGPGHQQRPHHKAAVAAHGKDAHARALAIAGDEVGIAGPLGMEQGAAHAAEHEREEDGPVTVQEAHQAQAAARQQHGQRHEPGTGVFVGQIAEHGLHQGRGGRIGEHQGARGLIVEAVGRGQIGHQRGQGAAVEVAAEVPQGNEQYLVKVHACLLRDV